MPISLFVLSKWLSRLGITQNNGQLSDQVTFWHQIRNKQELLPSTGYLAYLMAPNGKLPKRKEHTIGRTNCSPVLGRWNRTSISVNQRLAIGFPSGDDRNEWKNIFRIFHKRFSTKPYRVWGSALKLDLI